MPATLPLTLALSRGGDALSLNHVRSRSLHIGCMANARRHFLLALVAAPRCQAHGLDPCSDGELIGALRRHGGGGERGLLHREHFSVRGAPEKSPSCNLATSGPKPPPILSERIIRTWYQHLRVLSAHLFRPRMFIFTKRFSVTPTRNHNHSQLGCRTKPTEEGRASALRGRLQSVDPTKLNARSSEAALAPRAAGRAEASLRALLLVLWGARPKRTTNDSRLHQTVTDSR